MSAGVKHAPGPVDCDSITDTSVSISRICGEDERIRIEVEWPLNRLYLDMSLSNFAACVTGRIAPASVARWLRKEKASKTEGGSR